MPVSLEVLAPPSGDVSVASAAIRNADGTWAVGNPYAAKPGEIRNPKGKPLGSKARVIVEKAETQLAKKYVARALDDDNPNQDSNLRHAMDKFVPDAGRTDTLISVNMTRSDVLAELRRRGIAAPEESAKSF